MSIAETFAAAEAEDLWNRAPLMRLAYTAVDGSPRVIPLGYLPGTDRLVTWTIPTSVKVSSLQADPRVASPSMSAAYRRARCWSAARRRSNP